MSLLLNRLNTLLHDEKYATPAFTLARVAVSSVLLILCVLLHLSGFPLFLLLIIAALICSYDIIYDAITAVEHGYFLTESFVILIVLVLSFVLGYKIDSTACVIVYQVGKLLISYVSSKTKQSAMDLAQYQSTEIRKALFDNIASEGSGDMDIQYAMAGGVNPVLKLAMLIAVVYAICVPLITSITFSTSIHRALIILLVTIPSSTTVSIPLTGYIGMGYAAQRGVLIKNSGILELFSRINTIFVDKKGILTTEPPRVLSIESDTFDKKTFLNLAAHAVYYSQQTFAKAILDLQGQNLEMLDLISEFVDVPNCGVQLKVNGMSVMFGTEELFDRRGVSVPHSLIPPNSTVFYMTVADRYCGKIAISEMLNSDGQALIDNIRNSGIPNCILLTDDSIAQGEKLKEELEFDAFYAECDTQKKLDLIADRAEKSKLPVMYLYAEGMEHHTGASIDCRVGLRGTFADILIQPEFLDNFSFLTHISNRVRYVATENTLFVFIVKALLIFLAINGFTTLWFAVFLDSVAVMASILNCIRVTSESVLDALKYKAGK